MNSPQKRWSFRSSPLDAIDLFEKELNLSPVIARVLAHRGITNLEEAEKFLRPTLKDLADPFLMKDMKIAVERIACAIQDQEQITLYGDYDVDGTTGSSLLYLFLREIGARVNVYIPHRVKEGYGLNKVALRTLKQQGSSLVITVDNGISAVSEAEFARSIGLTLLIVDHHQVPDILPQAVAILNPKQKNCGYPYKELAAVGVAFNLALGLRSHLRKVGFFENRGEPNLKKYLDLVALGTIADVVPLTGQNRILVKEGLEVLHKSRNPGVIALKEAAGIAGPVNPGQVGFRLGPRINAVGRLETATLGFELLTSSDLNEARRLAQRLENANQERQALEEQMVQEALTRVEQEQIVKKRRSIVLFDARWHLGVIGIVASRLVDRFYLPTIVGTVEEDRVRCSARSISGFDLFESLQVCANHLEKFGGHRHAAGLSFKLQKTEEFWDQFDGQVRKTLREEQFLPSLAIDAELNPDHINEEFVSALEQLAPYGQGNPEPVFLLKDCVPRFPRQIGNDHLKFSLYFQGREVEMIGFKMGNFSIEPNKAYSTIFSCQWNEWQGNKKIQLKLADYPRVES